MAAVVAEGASLCGVQRRDSERCSFSPIDSGLLWTFDVIGLRFLARLMLFQLIPQVETIFFGTLPGQLGCSVVR